MIKFNIKEPNRQKETEIREKIDNLTKPQRSLGMLEDIALKIALIQDTLTPTLRMPHNVLFAGDHGIIAEGVSVSPKEVTWQQMSHFSKGGAGINFLCEQHGFKLLLVDAGVDFEIPQGHGIIDKKIRRSTRNFLYEPAMTKEEFDLAISHGADIIDEICATTSCNIISFGEMGSGNTSSASLWMHVITGASLETCVGPGAGLKKRGVNHKLEILKKALKNYSGSEDFVSRLAWFGGYELVMAVGAMLKAAERGFVIIVDGFIMTASMLAAYSLYPAVLDYALFGHLSNEGAHKAMLDYLKVKPILQLDMRLGEGTGAVCAYPIIQSAVKMINEMDSFGNANVTKYF